MTKSLMPLPNLRGGSTHQTTRRAKGVRKINSKDIAKRDNPTNKISLRIKNSRQASLKAHLKSILKELQNQEQIEMQIQNQSNILQDKTLIDPNTPTRKHLIFAIVPECDVLHTLHGVKAGEPF
jgi:hypothetical protein